MAAITTIQHKRRASNPFSGGDLATAEIGIDTTNKVLYFSSTGSDVVPIYSSGQSGQGSSTYVHTETASTYTAGSNDEIIILADATSNAITITLPAAINSNNFQFTIKKTDSSSNTITIDGSASETIDGGTTAIITTQYESLTIVCDGAEWWII